MDTVSERAKWLGIGAGIFGLLGVVLLATRRRGDLRGPNMLTMIATESQTPEEFARRAEAWASTQARPPGDRALVKAYPAHAPKLMRMIHDARKQRESASRKRFQSLIAQPEEDNLDGLGVIKSHRWDSATQSVKATPSTPKRKARELILSNLERVYYWREHDEYIDDLTEQEKSAIDEQISKQELRVRTLLDPEWRERVRHAKAGIGATKSPKTTWTITHAADITVEPVHDGSGKYKTINEVKSAVRSFIAYSNWNSFSKKEARQRVAWLTAADISEKPFRFGGH